MNGNKPVILIVDDESKIRHITCDILEHKGYEVFEAACGEDALDTFGRETIDLVLLDLKMPGMNGMEVLKAMMQKTPGLPIIMVTAHGDIPLAVEATQLGAVDFIEKPVEMNDLLVRIENQLTHLNQEQKLRLAADEALVRYGFVAVSQAMAPAVRLIDQASASDIRILLTGETGTGKELAAKAVHSLSRRKDKRFVKVNCAAIPEELIESELFGHKKGAFTGAFADKKGKFEMAHEGTLFLDEVADMSPMTQAKVLRALEDGEIQPVGSVDVRKVNVRVISATNRNLEDMVAKGEFREDLYYRLNVVNIHLPPLSSRKEDIPYLVQHFLAQFAADLSRKQLQVSRQAMELLLQRKWTGNIRELRNFMEKLVVLTDADVLVAHHIKKLEGRASLERDLEADLSIQAARERFEREYIHNKLIAHDWNMSQVARILEIDRTTLYRKMQTLGIEGNGR